MSKEASKKRREAEAKLIADLLGALPAFEMPRRSSGAAGTAAPRRTSGSALQLDDIANGVSSMSLSISATLPTLRYAAVFARKQALLHAQAAAAALSPVKAEAGLGGGYDAPAPVPTSLVQRAELPGLIVVFDPARRVYPISNGAPMEVAGEMVYVSENVMTYLGHSVQDILSRADSVYDLLLPEERGRIADIVARMVAERTGDERPLLCRFSNALFTRRVRTMSSDFKLMLVRARLLGAHTASPLVVFTCCPVLTPLYQRDIDFLVHEPGVFTFKCSPELIITRVDNRASQFLAFDDETELLGRRWLNLIHPDDLMAVVEQLRGVLGPNKRDDAATMFVARMMRAGDEAAPTRCIYVSVVLAYRHFGGAISSQQQQQQIQQQQQQQPQPQPLSPEANEAKPNTAAGVDSNDEAFGEAACQPSVTITCQVLPENNMEIVNEIKRYANPLFNCHGLSRSSANANANNAAAAAAAAANLAAGMGASGINNENMMEAAAVAPPSGHYRRNTSQTAAAAAARRAYQHGRTASYRSSVTSQDFTDVEAMSCVTAPVMAPALLSRRNPPSRRSSAASVPAGMLARMHASTSEYNLYVAQHQQQQPAMKRQRTSEVLYHADSAEASPMSYGGGLATTPPGFGDLTPQPSNAWTQYQQRWDQMSDCSASTGYAPQQPQPAFFNVGSTTPVGSPVGYARTGAASHRPASQHLFAKHAAAGANANPYNQRRPNPGMYATSPGSAHSLSCLEAGPYPSSNSNANPAGQAFFFASAASTEHLHQQQQPALNFHAAAPDVAGDAPVLTQPPFFASPRDRFFAEAAQPPAFASSSANFAAGPYSAAPVQHQFPPMPVPADNWLAGDYDGVMAPFDVSRGPMLASAPFLHHAAVPVTQQIHDRLARKASVKKVTEWLQVGYQNAAPVGGEASHLPELNGEDVASLLDDGVAQRGGAWPRVLPGDEDDSGFGVEPAPSPGLMGGRGQAPQHQHVFAM